MPATDPKVKQTRMFLPQPMTRGRLLRRYKRFLADVELETGEIITAHCANPGAMTGLATPGLPVWLSKSSNPKRKLAWNFDLVELPMGLVGINTVYPNRIVGEALRAQAVPGLEAYTSVRPEVKYGEASRVDFLLTQDGLPDCYVEVKNVHLSREASWAEFPDAATARGAKHLRELAAIASAGVRAVNLFLVQRTDCTRFRLAADIDVPYAQALEMAQAAGVEVAVFDCAIDTNAITFGRALSFAGQ